jgi:hypothetical protein
VKGKQPAEARSPDNVVSRFGLPWNWIDVDIKVGLTTAFLRASGGEK